MKYGKLYRKLMIAVGIAATLVIVMSQALPDVSNTLKKKAQTEQSDQDSDTTVISAPSEAVPGGIVELHDVDRFLLETISTTKQEVFEVPDFHIALAGYFNVLFRAIISPNAP